MTVVGQWEHREKVYAKGGRYMAGWLQRKHSDRRRSMGTPRKGLCKKGVAVHGRMATEEA